MWLNSLPMFRWAGIFLEMPLPRLPAGKRQCVLSCDVRSQIGHDD